MSLRRFAVFRPSPGGVPGGAPAVLLAALRRPAVLAHRGACRAAPENSLAALARAAELGADGVEFDVQPCGSGELVVFHDQALGRCTGLPGLVRDTPLARLRERSLDPIDPRGVRGERIPTLEEWLAAAPGGLFLNLEVKAERLAEAAIGAACARALASAGLAGRAVISSFHPAALVRARVGAPEVARATLVGDDPGWRGRLALGLATGPAALHVPATLATARRVALWHRLGWLVGVWTVDRAGDVERCLDAGADFVISNRPEVARRVAERYRR